MKKTICIPIAGLIGCSAFAAEPSGDSQISAPLGGSHGYLCHDFIDSILRGREPRVEIIDALNMTVPGYYAHLSSMKDGETMKIPQYSL